MVTSKITSEITYHKSSFVNSSSFLSSTEERLQRTSPMQNEPFCVLIQSFAAKLMVDKLDLLKVTGFEGGIRGLLILQEQALEAAPGAGEKVLHGGVGAVGLLHESCARSKRGKAHR